MRSSRFRCGYCHRWFGAEAGQTRIDLAQANVNIIKSVMPQITRYAPDAIYVVVSNPVDIITYAILKNTNLSENQVFGSEPCWIRHVSVPALQSMWALIPRIFMLMCLASTVILL